MLFFALAAYFCWTRTNTKRGAVGRYEPVVLCLERVCRGVNFRVKDRSFGRYTNLLGLFRAHAEIRRGHIFVTALGLFFCTR